MVGVERRDAFRHVQELHSCRGDRFGNRWIGLRRTYRDEVIEAASEKDDASADLALIAAAQKVEHYEISAYGTARTMAGQIGLPAIATLLNRSLAEEEIADNLMTQIARELMSESRTGTTKEPKRARTALSVDEE